MPRHERKQEAKGDMTATLNERNDDEARRGLERLGAKSKSVQSRDHDPDPNRARASRQSASPGSIRMKLAKPRNLLAPRGEEGALLSLSKGRSNGMVRGAATSSILTGNTRPVAASLILSPRG